MHWTITKKKSNYTYYSQMLSTKKGVRFTNFAILKDTHSKLNYFPKAAN